MKRVEALKAEIKKVAPALPELAEGLTEALDTLNQAERAELDAFLRTLSLQKAGIDIPCEHVFLLLGYDPVQPRILVMRVMIEGTEEEAKEMLKELLALPEGQPMVYSKIFDLAADDLDIDVPCWLRQCGMAFTDAQVNTQKIAEIVKEATKSWLAEQKPAKA